MKHIKSDELVSSVEITMPALNPVSPFQKIKSYEQAMKALALSLVGDAEAAHDLVKTTQMDAHLGFKSFERQKIALGDWLNSLLRFNCRSHMRNAQKHRIVSAPLKQYCPA